MGSASGSYGGRSYWSFTFLKIRMRDAAGMPQLQKDASALPVNCVRDAFPAGDVRLRVNGG